MHRFYTLKLLLCQHRDHLPHLGLYSYRGVSVMPQIASLTVRGLLTWNESKDRISAANCPLPNIERKESYPEKTCGKGIRIFYPLKNACGTPNARACRRDTNGASVQLKAGEPDPLPVVGGSAGSNLRASKLCLC